jgi:hypothetical protein
VKPPAASVPVVKVNGMRLLAAACKSGAQVHWPTVTGLITNANTPPEVKYYARFGGVSGLHQASSFPSSMKLSGYDMTFSRFALFVHHGFWFSMDTYKEALTLNEMWNKGKAPWKVW